MASKPRTTAGKKKQPAAVESSQSIADQTAEFLKSGGAIERINAGVSGQESLAPKNLKAATPAASAAKA
ncbi:hypothetical protein [Marinagarivorans algicola]|uniref:hypothetical protein n=1 Tax=Marinagarivorans algicola TaxID=1513270 RepID=UPI0006B4A30A|nr:hypothetical protein [Marinagarivorans algicola]